MVQIPSQRIASFLSHRTSRPDGQIMASSMAVCRASVRLILYEIPYPTGPETETGVIAEFMGIG